MERQQFRASTHIFLIKQNTILLYLRKWENQDGMYNLIAGHLDGWETPKSATIRESYEEAGIVIQEENLVFEHISHSITKKGKEYIQFYFSCTKWEGEIKNMEPEKCYSMEFFSLDTLPENITPYIRSVIENYKKWVSYSEFQD